MNLIHHIVRKVKLHIIPMTFQGICTLSIVIFPLVLFAQSKNYVKGEYLVQLKKGRKVSALIDAYQEFRGEKTGLRPIKLISPPFNIWQIRYKNDHIDQHEFLQAISEDNAVVIVQLNHKLQYRGTTPNDPGFSYQWQYINNGGSGGIPDADLDADEAWDITTGGVTILGDTIVVAIIDDGIDLTLSDWGDNLWVNRFEIPNNNIDDDNNGYVDDYLGWDADFGNDNVGDGGWHGTQLAGIIGAQGDNNNGVTGVNWNVKMMIIQGGGDEAKAISAYSYALTERRIYNNSNGAQGAFVVATNSSWGLDFQDASSAPLWCAFYDSMGAEGILSAAATTNSNANVDVVGDLPTTCPSDFLIAVTNIGRNDNHVPSGYGTSSIDLGAYGDDIWTVNYGGGYGAFGGTSAAAPHVAGAIGLLYAAPCPSLISLAKSNPAQAALYVKQYILDGVDSNASLANITVTGGRLNLNNALTELMNNCIATPCVQPFSIKLQQRTDTSATLEWSSLSASSFNIRYRQTNSAWMHIPTISDSIVISGLSACTNYEFEIEAICGSDSSGYAPTFHFTTDGCCEPPSTLSASAITDSSAMLGWAQALAAMSYNLRYKPVNSSTWITQTGLTADTLSIVDLSPCTKYEFQVQTVCSGPTTNYSNSYKFNTLNCGNCASLGYCNSSGDTEFEWIEAVEIGPLNNNSGNNVGYGNFTTSSTVYTRGDTFPLTLTPGFFTADDEYFVVWIDFNQDGDFNDAGEEVFDAGFASANPVSGSITIPTNALLGYTRMRVSMQWNNKPNACDAGAFIYGEVEDYCVSIMDTVLCPRPIAGFNYAAAQFSADFSDLSSGASEWHWDFGDGSTDSTQNPVYTYPDTGRHNVCLIASNNCGSDTICQTISISCPLPDANFQSTDSLLYVSFLNLSNNATSSLWNFGDGRMDTSSNTIHTYPDTGVYNACLIVENTCGMDTFCNEISISCPMPTANFSSNDSLLTVSFSDLSTNAIAWNWNFGDGALATQQNPSHTYQKSGTYLTCLTVSNLCGIDDFCDTINVVLTGVLPNYKESPTISVYPNPFNFKTNLYFNNQTADVYSLKLYNSVGRMVLQIDDIRTNHVEITGDNLTNGIYLFQLISPGGSTGNGKIILNKDGNE